MPSEPAISVIMPVYNGAAYLRAALAGVLAQTFPDFELLVVDDGSTDDSVAVVKASPDPRLRLLANASNLGPAESRNRALEAARGSHIAFFDSDDVAHPDWLRKGREIFQARAGQGMVAPWRVDIDAAGRTLNAPHGYADSDDKLPATMLFFNCLATSALLMDRKCIDGLRFRPDLAVASDYEMWARLVVRCTVFTLRESLVRYRVHPANITHRKSQLADACLRQIMTEQLGRLGLRPGETETDLHLAVTRMTFGTPKATVLAAERWLLKLQEANQRARVYEPGPFRAVLADRWHGVCHSACGHGKWTWKTFNSSALARGARIGGRRRLRLAYLVLRATIKNLLRRAAGPGRPDALSD